MSLVQGSPLPLRILPKGWTPVSTVPPEQLVHISFYRQDVSRYDAKTGKWLSRYDLIDDLSLHQGVTPPGFVSPLVPQIGDLVSMPGGTYRVIDRSIQYNAYGSPNWPSGQARPQAGPLVQCIVRAEGGLFADQDLHADSQDEDADRDTRQPL